VPYLESFSMILYDFSVDTDEFVMLIISPFDSAYQ